MTLAEIAKTDFLRPLLEEAGICHEVVASAETKGGFLELAKLDKQIAVVDYLITGKGRTELIVLLGEFQEIFETVRLHIVAELTRQRAQSDAGKEIVKRDAGSGAIFVLEFVVKGALLGRDDFCKGKEIFDRVSDEAVSDEAGVLKNLESLIDALIANPNLISDWIARLNEADKYLCASICPNQFPDNETLKRGIEIVTKEDWTPVHGAIALLKGFQQSLG